MKKYKVRTCLLLLIIISNSAYGQYKNNIWVVGLSPLLFTFKDNSLKDSIYTNSIRYRVGHSNISDSILLFSCNGFFIYDKNGDLMENGSNIIPNKLTNGQLSSNFNQQSIILPKRDNQHYVFIWGVSDNLFDSIQNGLTSWRYDILTYSIVDINQNLGKGKVISKMNYLLEYEDLSASQMSAVRHANGRDWWLVKPHNKKHLFYTFLVTPDGIEQQPIQEFDSPTFTNGVNGQSNFSPDGSLFAMTSTGSSLYTQINYFDRCTGKMTKFKSIHRPFEPYYNEYAFIQGVCISPNNRFVYLINSNFIYQYDLKTDSIVELNKDTLFNSCGYYLAYNSSDNRIFIGNLNKTCSAMSYIKYPDKKGDEAQLCRMCFLTQNNNTASPPNMPNYELSALKGSPCDTIGKLQSSSVVIYPNPASTSVKVFIPLPMNTNMQAYLYNALGQVVATWHDVLNGKQEVELPLTHIVSGMYILKVEAGELKYHGKLVVK